jgi:hypothetical protein
MSRPMAAVKSGTYVQGGGVAAILAAEMVKQQGGIFHRFGDGADLVQGGRESHEAKARDASVGWFDAHTAAKGRRLADGASRV